ncbi:MAG: 50S ribosomal protein L18 [Patescibacteria group bacterium]
MEISRTIKRNKRRRRIRTQVKGTAQRPRLCVHKSLRHLRVQLVDDLSGKTLAAVSTIGLKATASIDQAKKLGEIIGKAAQELGIKEVIFDRGGYRYHGQVKVIAEAARETGLLF